MITPLIIFVLVYVLLITEVVEKSVATILGAVAVIITGSLHWDQVAGVVDLDVLFLLIGMMTCVSILAETGFFECVAIWIAKITKGNAALILILMLLVTMIFSALLDNVTTIILLAPVTILITQLLELPSVPFLILEALASNIGGTATLVGDPPNIIIASKANLSFNDFLTNLAPCVVILAIIFIVIALMIMRKHLKIPAHVRQRVINSYPSEAIINKKKMIKSLCVFGLIFAGFIISHEHGIKPGTVALGGMGIMLVFCRMESEEMLKTVEWDAILFFIGLFIIIGALEHSGFVGVLSNYMLDFCGDSKLTTCMIILAGSALFSAVLDNIPFVIAMTPLVQKMIIEQQWFVDGMPATTVAANVTGSHPLFWALALGACLGGNGTLIGASANIVAAKVGERNGCRIGFLQFIKYGTPIMIVTVLIAMLYMRIFYF